MTPDDLHIEENVAKINQAWFDEILKYCDEAECEPQDLINAHKLCLKMIVYPYVKEQEKKSK